MKIRFNKMLSILCAVMLVICAVSVCGDAEQDPAATPTDLEPAEQETEEQETETTEEEEPEESPADSIEIMITKNLTLGQSWEGTVSKKKPAILKLDLEHASTVYMLLEGKVAWATVEKSDRITGTAPRKEINPETDNLVYEWYAEAGSYIITVGPIEPNPMAMVKVTFMTTSAYEAWEAAQEETEEEETEDAEEEKEQEETEPAEGPEEESKQEEELSPQAEEEPSAEPEEENNSGEDNEPQSEEEEEPNPEPEEENKPEDESGNVLDEVLPEENKPESEERPERHITVNVTWDVPDPVIGDTAHFIANLEGYDGLNYYIQWQYSPDDITWYDIPGERSTNMDVVVTEENNVVWWRILVYVEEDQND